MKALISTFAAAAIVAGTTLGAAAAVSTTTTGGGSSVSTKMTNVKIVRLSPMNRSGESGTATIQASGNGTSVVIRVTGEPAGASQPAHVHVGSCASPGVIRNGLNNVIAGRSSTQLGVPYGSFARGPLVIVVHQGTGAALAHYVSCGAIR
jgi:Cu/Zn superoxide dismutase